MSTAEAGRPRPRTAPDERRLQVLDVARELFSRDGSHHVSMDDIADRAAVPEPRPVPALPVQLDLCLVVVEEAGAELLRAVDRALSTVDPGAVRLGDGCPVVHAVVRAFFEFVESAGESFSLLFESDVMRDAAVRGRVAEASDAAARDCVLDEFTGLPAQHTALLAATLVGMAQTAAASRFRADGDLDVDEAVELVTRLGWQGVAGLVHPAWDPDAST